MSIRDMLAAALAYAARGWCAFPLLERAKEPATRRGFYDATTNPATIKRMFGAGFPYNIGIRTGQASQLIVLDGDDEEGVANLRRLHAEHGQLWPTLASRTARGPHLWFTTTAPVPCSNSRIAEHVDVRGDGGYAVAPPSVHPSGAVYQWINDLPPAPAPDWLIELAQRRPIPAPPQSSAYPSYPATTNRSLTAICASSARYGRTALEREIEALTLASSGHRNATLNLVSFKLHQLVAGEELHGDEVFRRLLAAAKANGLIDEDGPYKVEATIKSGARGLNFPRNRWGRK
jgi:Bifunctional DNA primase/polymerase, N-terminal